VNVEEITEEKISESKISLQIKIGRLWTQRWIFLKAAAKHSLNEIFRLL
jgi:hypothetical protein